jgi:hypothetical protein
MIEMLACDPRSVYRKDKSAGDDYPLALDTLHVLCRFDDAAKTATVHTVQLLAETEFAAAPTNVNNLESIGDGAATPAE